MLVFLAATSVLPSSCNPSVLLLLLLLLLLLPLLLQLLVVVVRVLLLQRNTLLRCDLTFLPSW